MKVDYVYVSNICVEGREAIDIVLINDKGIEQINEIRVETSGNIVFVIDVHCTFKGAEKLQQQGGVTIYRHLLQKFNGQQEMLKVVFYSPISQDDLVNLKPENYVLKLLPFVECKYEEGQFERELTKIISDNQFPLFNNASENLLSGWALYKADKGRKETDFVETVWKSGGETSRRRLVFIDDQIEEWKTTYKQIFEKSDKYQFLFYNKLSTSVTGFDISKISGFEKIKEADIIVSDFYLQEQHQPNNWMGKDQLEEISGYRLFEKIKGKYFEKGINKGACYIMHSSSNKIPYYRILEANGIDNWLVKDIRENVTIQEKLENFKIFKNTLEEYTSKDELAIYKALKNIWERIDGFNESQKWWQCNKRYNADETIQILKSVWFSLRQYANKQALYMEKSGVTDISYTPAAIISSLGKLNEAFKVEKLNQNSNSFQRFFPAIRNIGSHHKDLHQIILTDALIFLDCWLNALNSQSFEDAFSSNKDLGISAYMIQGPAYATSSFEYCLLYVYMQFYNSPYSYKHDFTRKLIRKRVDTLLKNANKKILLDEIKNHVYTSKDGIYTQKLKEIIAIGNIDKANDMNSFYIDIDQQDTKRILINYK